MSVLVVPVISVHISFWICFRDVLSAYVGTCGSGYLSPHFVLDLLS